MAATTSIRTAPSPLWRAPYVKQKTVVSTPYTTLNFVRTIEEVLGLPPLNLNDALAAAHGRCLQHHAEPVEFYRHALGLSLQYQLAAAFEARVLVVPQVDTQCEVLGARDARDGLLRRRSRRFGGLQPHSLEGDDGRPALSRRADRLDLRQNREELLARYRESLKQRQRQASKQNN